MELKIIVIKENKFKTLTNDHLIQGDCLIRCCLIQVQLLCTFSMGTVLQGLH